MPASAHSSVYISHVIENSDLRERVAQRLRRAEIGVWDNASAWNLRASQSELERGREHCWVFVLLVSPRYLDSDVIRKSELPGILSLLDTGRRIIYVIAEPCLWETVLPRQQFAVVPYGDTPLSARSEKQIEDDLDILVREVGRALQETDKVVAPPQHGVAPVDLRRVEIDPHVTKLIPRETAVRYKIMPVARVGSVLTIAMSDPTNVFAMDDVKFMTGLNVEPKVASESAIAEAIRKYYGQESSAVPSTNINQVRINELARELEVKAKAIVDLLPEYGITEKKTHSSWIPADVAEKVRRKIQGAADEEAQAEAAAKAKREAKEAVAKAARVRPPASHSVYISYAPEDGSWRDRIAAHLSDATFDVWEDSQTNQIQRFLPAAEPSVEGTRVFILLVSFHYLESDEIHKTEFPYIRSLVQDGSRRIIYVILEQCPWSSRLALGIPATTIPVGGKTLSERNDEEVREDLHTLTREVRRAIQETDKEAVPLPPDVARPTNVADRALVPLTRVKDFSFSPTAKNVLDYAKQIASKSKPSPHPLSSSSLLFALVEMGRTSKKTTFLAPQFLYTWISMKDETAYQTGYDAYLNERGSASSNGLEFMTENLLGILQRAAEIAKETTRSSKIHVRHLLASLLVFKPNEPYLSARWRLSRMGFDLVLLQRDFLRFMDTVPSDDHEAWDRVLSVKDADPIPSESVPSAHDAVPLPSSDISVIEKQSVLAGYQSDDPSGADLLGIGDEVRALASVLAAKDVDPPLSLGLFGDWGAGKSFFMHQLAARIKELQDDAKLAEGGSAYCQNIVQITFNAWNYIDCNLWASLTAEIFENLAAAIAQTRGQDSPEERALALAAASSSQEVLAEAEKRKAEAEQELKLTEEKLAALQKSEAELEATLDPGEILKQAFRFAMQDDEVQKQLDAAANALRIPAGVAAANEVRSEIIELHGTGNAIILTLKNNRYLWVWILILGLVLGASWLVPRLIFETTLPIFATRALALLTAVSAFLAPLVKASRKAMLLVNQAKASKQALVEQRRKEQTDKVKMERGQIQQKVEAARRNVDEASAKAKALNEQLEKMRADRQMVDYIRQRHQSTDYTQHLGIISRVRADLRHLSTLLRAVKEEREKDAFEAGMKERQAEKDRERKREGKQPLFPRIDRIVLYIDDLDRCREKNVVEVLQAVHLLLAFPLFVVVVGVDPRWLLHSLRQNSQAFQNDEIENGAGKLHDEEKHWVSTPLNYLEKIFQIPFSLRPIEKKGFGNIVDTFARSKQKPDVTSGETPFPDIHEEPKASPVTVSAQARAAPSPKPNDEVPSSPGASAPLDQTYENVTGTSAQPLESQQLAAISAIDRNPDQLQIRDWERAFMKELDEFIPTPRAGKRFLNIYRLVRASVKTNELEAFTGNKQRGGYQIAILLLAILTGYPSQATEILRALIEEEPTGTWWQFTSSFKERKLDKSAAQESPKLERTPNISKTSTSAVKAAAEWRAERESWVELFEKLGKVKDLISDRPCKQFVEWAPRVARYSFQSGRVLSCQKR